MSALRLVLGDQLSADIAALADADPKRDIILMAEVQGEATYVRHHKQKIVLVFAAMRHFAADLRARGFHVRYVAIDDPENTGSLLGESARALKATKAARLVVTEPGEWRLHAEMETWRDTLGAPVEIRPDTRFYRSIEDHRAWFAGRAHPRMEFFYREMRRQHNVLMDLGEPEGGRWNFDAENRKALPKGEAVPAPPRFAPDKITKEAMRLAAERFPDHFGTLDDFGWATTRADALKALAWFIENALPRFGDYQDAMRRGAPFLYHSALSPYLNLGLLSPREMVDAAVRAYARGAAPLNAVEGFVRQILGWREYVRGLYWARMPDYAASNALEARAPLPAFYWTGDTAMECMADVVRVTRDHAYAHHIQRLMVAGNLAMLWGVAPHEIEEWFLIVYADAYDWVELPNTHGMATYADGGVMASKPYAASGAYINRMSDYCGACAFDPKQRMGARACPFTTLYWDFLMRHETRFKSNPRMAMPLKNLSRLDKKERTAIARDAGAIRSGERALTRAAAQTDLFAPE